MAQLTWWNNTVKMVELLREREAQRIANNVPLALGELSELIKARADAGSLAAIYIAVPSKAIEERVSEWAQHEGLHVAITEQASGTVLCISWGTACEEGSAIDGRFLHDGKLVLLKAH